MGMQRIRRTYCLLFSDTKQYVCKLLRLYNERQVTGVHAVDLLYRAIVGHHFLLKCIAYREVIGRFDIVFVYRTEVASG